jgi:excinuclease UvrABC nuclease subunit
MMETEAEEIFENCLSINNELSGLPNSAGLVFFADSQNLPIVLLTTANIKRAVKTKLAEKIDPSTSLGTMPNKRADLKSITAIFFYSPCRCKFRLAIKHLDAAKKIFGQKYKDYIKLVSPYFIQINLQGKFPLPAITKKPSLENEIIGPFAGMKSAGCFLKVIEDAFGLCKRGDLVHNPAAAKSCPYLQMAGCAAVCSGKTSPAEYANLVKAAFDAAEQPAETIEKMQKQMQAAAKELNFESAGALKKKIEKLSALNKPCYRWTGNLKKLRIVHIEKLGKTKKQVYAAFAINPVQITDMGDLTFADDDEKNKFIANAFDRCGSFDNPAEDFLERFAIVSYFLYRTKPAGLWLRK